MNRHAQLLWTFFVIFALALSAFLKNGEKTRTLATQTLSPHFTPTKSTTELPIVDPTHSEDLLEPFLGTPSL